MHQGNISTNQVSSQPWQTDVLLFYNKIMSSSFHSRDIVDRGQSTNQVSRKQSNGTFSRNVTAAILVFQNKEIAAILLYQTSPLGVELYFYAKIVFGLSKPIRNNGPFPRCLCLSVKRVFVRNRFYKKGVFLARSFSCKPNSFSHEKFCT